MSGMAENLSVNSQIVERILKEGMEDGSIRSQDPLCAAQVLMLLLNYWTLFPHRFKGAGCDTGKGRLLPHAV